MNEYMGGQKQIVRMRGVSKSYDGKTVIDNIDLDMYAGECLVLIGHNGAGKTTLMKLALGLSKPDAGSLSTLDNNPRAMSPAQRRKIGYLPESVAFQGAMSGREVLAFYAALKGVDHAECKRLLELVGLDDAAGQKISTYSKGMRQRLGLAQAILGKPELLVLDEPTSGMDPVLRRKFYDVIDALRSTGTTSFISSHALNEVEARADRFVIMKAGRFVASGTLKQLATLATLPISVRISVTPGSAGAVAQRLSSAATIKKVNDHTVDLDCDRADKMGIVRQISALGSAIDDMDIIPPKLDEIYMHFMQKSN